MSYNILIVDDDPLHIATAKATIEKMPNYNVLTAAGGREAINLLALDLGKKINLMLLDLSMPAMDGIDVLRAIKPICPDLPIIVYTAYGDIRKSVDAIKEGAIDFVLKQDGPERLQLAIKNAIQKSSLHKKVLRLSGTIHEKVHFSDIIGSSKAIEDTKIIAKRAALSSIPVFINGESGVGKELFARAIHYSSIRAKKSFVPVNCAAIPENLVESVLFGHEKGSFTGASERTIGKFREADGGTLFLDEIGELKPSTQVKLLRALQEGEVEPVGSNLPVKVNVRLISATNCNLRRAVEEKLFREDLYYRLNVFPITIPALRARVEDIEPLLDHFCQSIAATEQKKILGITDTAKQLLKTYRWPGNIRQLKNVVYRAIVLCNGEFLDEESFSNVGKSMSLQPDNLNRCEEKIPSFHSYKVSMLDNSGDFKKLIQMEKEVIEAALNFYDWHISNVARQLNIGRSTLYRKIDELGIKEVRS